MPLNTLRRLIHSVLKTQTPPPRQSDGVPRSRFLEVAYGQLGYREEGGNNAGPQVARYKGLATFKAKENLGPWCASFVSWCMMQAGFTPDNRKEWHRNRHRAKWLYRYFLRRFGSPDGPEIGALVCWHRGKANARTGHIGIVTGVGEHGQFTAIEGNRGGVPAKVQEFTHVIGEAGLLGFARVC